MVAIVIAFVEYLVAAFIISYVAQLSNKHRYVWIFLSTGIYLFDAHFIVFSYLYNVSLFSVESFILIISGTSLMLGSVFLYHYKELWYIEDVETRKVPSGKKLSHW